MISLAVSFFRFVFRTTLLIGFLLFLLVPRLMLVNYYRNSGTQAGSRKADTAAVRLANRLAWFFGIRTRVSGTPAQGAVLVAANHISWLDIPVLHSAWAMGFVGKEKIEQWPVLRYITRTGGTIFHQRGSHDAAADVNSMMVQRLQQGRRVAIFPEGGILPGAEVRVFHARMFRAAVDVECPVQPVMVRYIRNGRRDDDILFRKGESMLANFSRLLARPGAIADVHFLPTISVVGKPRRALADAARAAIISIYEEQ